MPAGLPITTVIRAWVDPWGWTWVDDAPWGFAPVDYGRWAYVGGVWGWIPGWPLATPIYAPALVAWVGGAGFNFGVSFGGGAGVGWFPLGPRDVFIPSYQVSPAYVTRVNVTNTTVINNVQVTNVYNTYTRTGNVSNITYTNQRVPGAFVAVPQNALASARPVQQAVVKVPENQLANMKPASAAPQVAPQREAVLGHPASAMGHAPAPPAAAVNVRVVAKTTPPPPPVPFAQKQALLTQNAGRPLSPQQQQQVRKTYTPPRHATGNARGRSGKACHPDCEQHSTAADRTAVQTAGRGPSPRIKDISATAAGTAAEGECTAGSTARPAAKELSASAAANAEAQPTPAAGKGAATGAED